MNIIAGKIIATKLKFVNQQGNLERGYTVMEIDG